MISSLSLDPSLLDFIQSPLRHHLVKDGTTIKAIAGPLCDPFETDQLLQDQRTTHEVALKALNDDCFFEITGLGNDLSAKDLITRCQQAHFCSNLIIWALKLGVQDIALKALGDHSFDIRTLNENLASITVIPDTDTVIPDTEKNKFCNIIINWAIEGRASENRSEAAGTIMTTFIKNLTYLILRDLNLTSLPEEIFELKQLTLLCLKSNKLSTLSDKIGELTQISFLDLSFNNITNLPESILFLKDLKDFYFAPATNGQVLARNPFLAAKSTIAGFHRMQSEDDFTEACSINGLVLKYIDKKMQTVPLVAIAIHQNPASAKFVANPQTLKQICQLNGLSLEFIPEDRQTRDLVLTAITQNPASIAFARPDFITYELAKRAVALDPSLARFIPNHLIDIPTVLEDIASKPYLLSLLVKVGAFDRITNDMYEQAMAYDGRLISCLPAELQNSDFGHDLISLALKQTPLAYYGIEPVFFDAAMLRVLIEAHKDKKHNADLYSIVQKILVKIDVNDPLAHDHYFPIADELTFSYKDDPIIMAFLIAKYGKTLVDASDNLRRDYDFVFAAIDSHPDNSRESLVIDLGQQRLLEEYARERRRQL